MTELEQALVALGRELDLPPEPDLVPAVRARLGDRPRGVLARRRALVLALAALAVAVAAAAAVPSARTTILRFFHLRGVTVERVDTLPAARARPLMAGLGRPVPRARAERLLGFRILLPPFEAKPPRSVYVGDGFVAIPLDWPKHRQLLLSEFRGDVFGVMKKAASPATTIEQVQVGRDFGLWLGGAKHVLTYVNGNGEIRQRTVRLAGNVLLWQHGELSLRLEGPIDEKTALRIARLVH
jgi:hypothetical protein